MFKAKIKQSTSSSSSTRKTMKAHNHQYKHWDNLKINSKSKNLDQTIAAQKNFHQSNLKRVVKIANPKLATLLPFKNLLLLVN